MFNLAQLEINDTAEYTVTDARGNDVIIDGVPLTITLASPGTDVAVNAQFKRDEARSSRMLAGVGGKASKRTAKDDYIERTDFLVAITREISHPNVAYGEKTGMAAIRAMYMEPKVAHVAEGAEKFHADRGNYCDASANGSSNA